MLKRREEMLKEDKDQMTREKKTLIVLMIFNMGYVLRGIFDIAFLRAEYIKARFFGIELAH